MRKLSAHYVITGTGSVLPKAIVTLDNTGTVLSIEECQDHYTEQANVEFFSGVLVPGFVNAHCHLELSHLKGEFQNGTGLPEFLKKVVTHREVELEKIHQSAGIADLLMKKNGIVAVGDISNNRSTFALKCRSEIHYHTFIEALGFHPARAEKAFGWTSELYDEAIRLGLAASIVPHSPYSISKDLFEYISNHAIEHQTILSIHNQESPGEDHLYQSGTGEIANHLKNNLNLDLTFFQPTGEKAINTILSHLPKHLPLLLVHNIETEQEDLDRISAYRDHSNTWMVLCPNSNLYIGNKLPPVELFRSNYLQVCIGTDSLASNTALSVLEELKTLQYHFSDLSLEELIGYGCLNGAKALGIDHWAGSIEVGKRPGINLLTSLDLKNLRLTSASTVRRLI